MNAQHIIPFLWFNDNAEEAVDFYISAFTTSVKKNTTRYTAENAAMSGLKAGSVMTVSFTIAGQEFSAMEAHMDTPIPFTPAVSFVVNCNTQAEIDHYWDKLAEGGDVQAQQCGWLTDRYGVSWQIVPAAIGEWMSGSDPRRSGNVMKALLPMKKLDIETLQRTYNE